MNSRENKMTDKKKIKIDITDFWLTPEQNKMDRKIAKILSKHYDVQISDKPDFLFYSCDGLNHRKYKNCVKIFYTEENVIPDFNECDYASGFDYIEFGDRYLRKLLSSINRSICNRSKVDEGYLDRKFCNFIYSNTTSGEGAVLRQQFCQKLMKYKEIDCPGKVLNNMSTEDLAPRRGDWQKSKLEFLKKYKFTIAFENSSSNGYTTEKLPANLLQAQRDYFGAHTYERLDSERGKFFHTNWTGHGGNTSASEYKV